MSVIHRALNFPGYWRIASFGKLTELPNSSSLDIRILVRLGKLIVNSHTPVSAGRFDGDLVTAYLPIGELPRLHLNAILHDGKLHNNALSPLQTEVCTTKQLNFSRTNLTVFERFHTENNNLIIPKSRFSIESNEELTSLFVGVRINDDPYAIIIPSIEIFRFFYATSDVLTKALLRDQFLDPHTNLWDMTRTALASDGRAIIWLRRRILDADARFLARFAFDAYALKCAQDIALYAAAKGTRLIRAIPPFQDTVNLKFLCKKIESIHHQPRLIVTRLISCDWKPPFNELVWDRDNDGRYDPDHRDERAIQERPVEFRALDFPQTEPSMLEDSAPSHFGFPSRLQEEEISERFPLLGDVLAKKQPQVGTKSKSEPSNWKAFFTRAFSGSVVEGFPSAAYVGKAVIEAKEKRPRQEAQLTSNIDETIGAIDYQVILDQLVEIQNCGLANIEFLVVLDDFAAVKGVKFNVYPRKIGDKSPAWLYIDDQKQNSRMALLACINYLGQLTYLLELQPRKSQRCSTLVFWKNDRSIANTSELSTLVMDCAHAKGTKLNSASSLGFQWSRLHHIAPNTFDEDSLLHFVERISYATPLPCDSEACIVI